MNKLKKILNKPIKMDEFIVYIDTKTVERFGGEKRFYDIYFESTILDTTKNKFYKSSDGHIKGDFDYWLPDNSIDSEIRIYLDKPEKGGVQFLMYCVSDFFQRNEFKHIIRMCKRPPIGYKNIFMIVCGIVHFPSSLK